jgi:serine/threonine protein phosphatase PrpC
MTASARPFVAARATATGARVNNEDRSFFFSAGETLFCGIADGLGGHPRGEVAAQLLVDVCEARFRESRLPIADPAAFMLDCVRRAHHAILAFGDRQRLDVTPRTTAALAIVQDSTAHWLHVGDSRLYLVRGQTLSARTEDHVHDHYVQAAADPEPHLRTSLTRCLGGVAEAPLSTCCGPCPLAAGDALLICSDGLWSQVQEPRLLELAGTSADRLAEDLQALVDEAAAQPGSDNVTAIVLQWQLGTGRAVLNPEALRATVCERAPDDLTESD